MTRYEIVGWDGTLYASYVKEELAWEHFLRLPADSNFYELREVTSTLLAFKGDAR